MDKVKDEIQPLALFWLAAGMNKCCLDSILKMANCRLTPIKVVSANSRVIDLVHDMIGRQKQQRFVTLKKLLATIVDHLHHGHACMQPEKDMIKLKTQVLVHFCIRTRHRDCKTRQSIVWGFMRFCINHHNELEIDVYHFVELINLWSVDHPSWWWLASLPPDAIHKFCNDLMDWTDHPGICEPIAAKIMSYVWT
jgi:hypothetical protein